MSSSLNPGLGNAEAAQQEIARLEKLGELGFGVGYDLTLIHAALGELDAAIGALERGIADRSQVMGYMNVEPGFDSIRDDPRFAALSRRIRLS